MSSVEAGVVDRAECGCFWGVGQRKRLPCPWKGQKVFVTPWSPDHCRRPLAERKRLHPLRNKRSGAGGEVLCVPEVGAAGSPLMQSVWGGGGAKDA